MNEEVWDVSSDVDQALKSDNGILVIRNNSSLRLLDILVDKLGQDDSSGRYFIPSVKDIKRIRSIAEGMDLYVKVSKMRGVTVLDIMRDRTKINGPRHR